ncbi:hypothetical protein RUND412_008506 [Rhizina undulata]
MYGAVPGRYANRIGNATFTLDGVFYHTPMNDGNNTLHSGPNGWGYRQFNVSAVSDSSIMFSIYDPNNSTGIPESVYTNITYALTQKFWNIKMDMFFHEYRTPIMLWGRNQFYGPGDHYSWGAAYRFGPLYIWMSEVSGVL